MILKKIIIILIFGCDILIFWYSCYVSVFYYKFVYIKRIKIIMKSLVKWLFFVNMYLLLGFVYC